MSRPRLLALAGLLGLVGAACASPASSPDPAPAAPPALTGELRQFRSDLVRRGLQVTVTARAPLTTTAVLLETGGFATLPPTEVDVALPAGTPQDLPVLYGAADCAGAPGRAVATLTTPTGPISVPLDDRGLLARLHSAECSARALAAAVEVTVEPVFTPVVRDGRRALAGTVRLVRRQAGEQVVLDGLGANVIFSVLSTSTATPLLVLGPQERQATVPVVLVPARCDPHALAESKRTSLLAAYLGLGERPPRLTTLTPPKATRDQLEAFAVDGCRRPTP